jgi:hypothetical protein
MRQALGMNLDRAKSIAFVLTLAPFLELVLPIAYPFADRALVLLTIATPLVALALVALYGEFFYVGNLNKRREARTDPSGRADLVMSLILPGILLGWTAVLHIRLVDPTQVIVPAVAGATLMTGLAVWLAPETRRIVSALPLAICFAAYAGGTVTTVNTIFDGAQPETYKVTVLNKRQTSGRGRKNYFAVSPWGSYAYASEITVPYRLYYGTGVGQTICIRRLQGALGLPWFYAIGAEQCQ